MVQKKQEVKLRTCALYIIGHFNTSEVCVKKKTPPTMEWCGLCSCTAYTVWDARIFIPLLLLSFYIQLIIIIIHLGLSNLIEPVVFFLIFCSGCVTSPLVSCVTEHRHFGLHSSSSLAEIQKQWYCVCLRVCVRVCVRMSLPGLSKAEQLNTHRHRHESATGNSSHYFSILSSNL